MSNPIQFREIKLESGWLHIRPERQDLGKAMAIVRKHKDRLMIWRSKSIERSAVWMPMPMRGS